MRKFYSLFLLFTILTLKVSVQAQPVTDYDDNQYHTAVIGLLEWFSENLKTTHYSDGTPIINAEDNEDWEENTSGAYSWYGNNIDWKEAYGAIYNWHSVNSDHGLCPEGWRVPSQDDFDYLVDYLVNFEGHELSDLGTILKSCRQVEALLGGDCDTDVHPRWNRHDNNYGRDLYSFSALPGGSRMHTGNFGFMGSSAGFWLSSESTTEGSARAYHFSNFNTWLGSSHSEKNRGYSVRCVRDVDATLPEVGATEQISEITATRAKSGGEVIDEGNVSVISRGVVWSTSQGATVENNTGKSSDGRGEGRFTSWLVGLSPQTTYYVRAYATNAAGTVYGNELEFTTLQEVTTSAVAPQGAGTDADPYLIASFENLLWISENSNRWTGHYRQTSDIDASPTAYWRDGKGWKPVGSGEVNSFRGVYDGDGHIIDGLFINRPDQNGQGLFGYISNGAQIKNLGVTNVYVSGGDWYTGALVGYSRASYVSRCFSTGTVKGAVRDVGGLVGRHHYLDSDDGILNSSITNSYSHCSVEGLDRVGGLIGKNSTGSSIINSYSTGEVRGQEHYTGGLAGRDMSSPQEPVSNYWDMESSGMTNHQIASSKSTNQMKIFSTFLWWDFKGEDINGTDGIWNIGNDRNNGYPYLAWQYPDDPGIDAGFSGGDGTADNPYLITSAEELNLINFQYLNNEDVHFALAGNIDLDVSPFNEAQGWVPIGTNQQVGAYTPPNNVRAFSGYFYGNGYTISGVTINRLYSYQGLFGYLLDAYIENLGVVDVEIYGGHRYIGGLAGYSSASEILNCFTTGKVAGVGELFLSPTADWAGGLVGYNIEGSLIKGCYSTADVSGWAHAGGLVGGNDYGGVIENSSSSGTVTSLSMSGGFVGFNNSGSAIRNSYSRGNVIIREGAGEMWVGGFAGANLGSEITNSYSTGSVTYLRGASPEDKGFCGGVDAEDGFLMSGNYWDTETSGQSSSVCNATGSTTENMTYSYGEGVYGDWDFDLVWSDDTDESVNDGYPFHMAHGYSVTFSVVDVDGGAIPNAVVTLGNNRNSEGDYLFENISPGTYWYSVVLDSYIGKSGVIEVIDQDQTVDVLLEEDVTSSYLSPESSGIVLYPNPATSVLNISSDEPVTRVRIYNVGGQVLKDINVNELSLRININSLPPGLYLVQVHTDSSFITKRIRKQL